MCLKPKPLGPIPEATRQLGEKLLPENNLLRRIGDKYAEVVKDEDFADMYSPTGQPALSPARLSLVVVLQAMEHLSDRQAAAMVRTRLDWKYALHLALDDAGFDASVLSEFRQRLVTNQAERRLFDALLERLKAEGFLKGRRVQRTDSLAILGAVRELNRLELVMETLRLALEALAEKNNEWLAAHTPAEWTVSYGEWTQAERVVKESGPRGKAETEKLLVQTGKDGFRLLEELAKEATPVELRELAAVKTLAQVWRQQYRRVAAAAAEMVVELHTADSRKADGVGGDLVASPQDVEVRYSEKRGQGSTGYKLQWTETATEDAPAIVTDVDAVKGTAYDGGTVAAIHERLHERAVLPDEHLVDSAYVNGNTIVESAARGVALIGPIAGEVASSPAQTPATGCAGEAGAVAGVAAAGGGRGTEPRSYFAVAAFGLDFAQKVAVCPAGQRAQRWQETIRKDRGQPVVLLFWAKSVCQSCAQQPLCTAGITSGRTIKVSPNYPVIAARRQEQRTPEFQERYRRRSGIEASFSDVVGHHGGRQTPYRGQDKTRGHYIALAVGINFKRVTAWESGQRPRRQRVSRLGKLMGRVSG